MTANQAFARTLVRNILMSRGALASHLIDPKRNIDAECGYPSEPTLQDYDALYSREGIATRVVHVLPDESWSMDPEIVEGEQSKETKFETELAKLIEEHNLFSVLCRADGLSGIGSFGVIVLGIDDGNTLDQPVDGVTADSDIHPVKTKSKFKLLYVRPLDESAVSIKERDRDPRSPRFMRPSMYAIRFDTASQAVAGGTSVATITPSTETLVHWSRVIHLADNRRNDDTFGTPRMRPVFNRLYDLRKLMSGATEMFWKGGFPGIGIEANSGGANIAMDLDVESISEELEKYFNGLQRSIAVENAAIKSLAPQVADPLPHFEMNIKAICIALRVPYRIFMGTEEAQLAGSQDMRVFNRRLQTRQQKYLTPYIVRPLVNRLITYGTISFVDAFDVNWKDLNTLGDIEKADVTVKRTDALAKYLSGGVDTLVPPREYMIQFLDMPADEVDAIEKAAEKYTAELEEKAEEEAELMREDLAEQDVDGNDQIELAAPNDKMKQANGTQKLPATGRGVQAQVKTRTTTRN
jgi:hypothetical protein